MNKYDIPPVLKKKTDNKNESKFKVKYEGEPNIINDSNAEINMLKDAFKSKLDRENEMKAKNINPNFWFAVYFQDESQKEEFLKKAKINHLTKGQFINGIEFANEMGIDIKRKDVNIPSKFKGFKTK